MRKVLIGAALVAPLVLVAPVQAQVINLVDNANFSADFVADPDLGWVKTGDPSTVSIVGGVANVSAIGTAAGFRQNIPTTPGDLYSVSFLFAGALAVAPYTAEVKFGGNTVYSVSNSPNPLQNIGLGLPQTYTASFWAVNPTTLLEFSAFSASASPFTASFQFDDVSVERVPGPLPLLGAVAAFAWSRKLRARIKDARQQGAEMSPA